MKSDVEVFVYKKKEVVIVCPQCKLEKTIDVEKIRDTGHWGVHAKCKRCGHLFTVSFNFRKYYRKSASLTGQLFASPDSEEPLANVRIHDVSLTGVGFSSDGSVLDKNAVMTLRFTLDDPNKSNIEKGVVIESIRNGKIGARFVGDTVFDTVLNKYILSK